MLLKINSVHARNMKFGTNLPCEKFYKADQAILNLFISDILWAKMCPKIAAKNQIFKIATSLFVERHTRKVHSKFRVSSMYSVRMNVPLRNHDLKFTRLCLL